MPIFLVDQLKKFKYEPTLYIIIITMKIIIIVVLLFVTGIRGNNIAKNGGAPLVNITHEHGNTSDIWSISSTKSRMYYYVENVNESTNLRLSVKTTPNASLEYPIYVNVIEPRILLSSFELPFAIPKRRSDNNPTTTILYKGSELERTLCLLGNGTTPLPLPPNTSAVFTVSVSTRSPAEVDYSIDIVRTEDFVLSNITQFNVSPSAPVFKLYRFRKGEDFVKILVSQAKTTTRTTYCLSVSIQPATCPIFDLEDHVRYQGKWMSVNSSGLITVEKAGLYKNGFVLVVLANSDNASCVISNPFPLPLQFTDGRTMDLFNVRVDITGYRNQDTIQMLLNTCIPLCLTTLVAVIATLVSTCRNSQINANSQLAIANNEERPEDADSENAGSNNIEFNDEEANNDYEREHLVLTPGEERDYQNGQDDFVGTAPKTMAELTATDETTFKCYTKLSCIATWYYIIPAIQFAIYYYRISLITGDSDICYYNFRCANKVGPFEDFNHFYSNSSYLILGAAYLFIIWRKKVAIANVRGATNHGVNISYGMFQALGVALIVEGILSASYHLCPNQATFQFDTCFMYIIAVLLLISLHQFRHPPLFFADDTFLLLVCFLVIPVAGYLTDAMLPGHLFIWIFSAFQVLVMLFTSLNYCLVGFVYEENRLITGQQLLRLKHLPVLKQVPWKRYILPGLCSLASFLLLPLYYLASIGFASYLLYLLIANVLFILTYYCGLKKVHGEYTEMSFAVPLTFFGAAMLLGSIACWNFLHAATGWDLSSSASREINRECYDWPGIINNIPPFYDSHDIWHFFSAAALFLAFMGLLVLDDDLMHTPKENIRVF